MFIYGVRNIVLKQVRFKCLEFVTKRTIILRPRRKVFLTYFQKRQLHSYMFGLDIPLLKLNRTLLINSDAIFNRQGYCSAVFLFSVNTVLPNDFAEDADG